jgi:hypothetical protein
MNSKGLEFVQIDWSERNVRTGPGQIEELEARASRRWTICHKHQVEFRPTHRRRKNWVNRPRPKEGLKLRAELDLDGEKTVKCAAIRWHFGPFPYNEVGKKLGFARHEEAVDLAFTSGPADRITSVVEYLLHKCLRDAALECV